MTCAECDDRLDDYVDGLLDEAAFQEIELHLAGCETCRRGERRLRALLAQAAALPCEVAPGRELWPGVAARLRPRRARPLAWLGTLVRRGEEPARLPHWLAPTLAAAAALLALSTLVPRAGHAPTDRGGRPYAVSSGHDAAGLGAAEAEYTRATAELMEALQARRATLPAATAATVDENLRTVDKALRDIRVALERDPQNAQLARLLSATHRRKVAFLQQLVKLTTQL